MSPAPRCPICKVRLAAEGEEYNRCAVCADTIRKEFRAGGVTRDQAALEAF